MTRAASRTRKTDAPDAVHLDAPLPTDRATARAVLDAACLALWGGTEWAKRRRPRREMPASWRATIASGARDKREKVAA